MLKAASLQQRVRSFPNNPHARKEIRIISNHPGVNPNPNILWLARVGDTWSQKTSIVPTYTASLLRFRDGLKSTSCQVQFTQGWSRQSQTQQVHHIWCDHFRFWRGGNGCNASNSFQFCAFVIRYIDCVVNSHQVLGWEPMLDTYRTTTVS